MRYPYIAIPMMALITACSPSDTSVSGDVEAEAQTSYFNTTDIETAIALRDRALEGSGAYELLDDLVTTAPNRLPGGPDDLKAVAWAKQAFEELGFDKVWTEPVTLPGWARVSASAQVIGHEDLDFNIVSLGKSVSTPEGGITASIAHIASYEALVETDSSEIEGKIVFISNRMKPTDTGSGYGEAVIARSKGHSVVAEKGGLALLIRSIGTDDSDYPHTGTMSFEPEDGVVQVFESTTGNEAWSVQFGMKTVASAALSNQDADDLQNLLESGEEVTMFVDIQNQDLGEITTYNIIGEITGASRPNEIVLTGGHIDAWDLGVGAMDDGMGVTITASAVGLIADLDHRPARTIRMVAFAAEEVGIYGGKAYAEQHGDEDHVFGSELDYGLGGPQALVPNISGAAIPVLKEIWTVLEPLGLDWITAFPGFLGADLGPLEKQGLSGAMLAVEASRYFDHHHTATDTMDLIEPRDLDMNTAAYAVLLYLTAQYEGRFDQAIDESGTGSE